MDAIFFKNQLEFRAWLKKNHHKKKELQVGFYKVGSGKLNMTWSQSVDEALCYGWIDGVRKSIDETRYMIRFTPRKTTSIWSSVNIKKVSELTKAGLMQPAGLEAFSHRKEEKSSIYSYEKEPDQLSEAFLKEFKSNKKAWNYFQTRPASYKNPATHWVMTAKQEGTRLKRLKELIADSEAERRIKRLTPINRKV